MTETSIGSIGDFALQHGGVLRDAHLAYVTHGRLASDARNAVLLTHGYTGSHRFADGGAAAEGRPYGHLAPGADAAKWALALARVLAELR